MEAHEFKGKVWEVKWKSHEFRAEFLKKKRAIHNFDKYFFRLYIDGVFIEELRGMLLSSCMGDGRYFSHDIEIGGKKKLFECYLRYRNLPNCPPDFNIIDRLSFRIGNRSKSRQMGIVMYVEGKVIYDSTVGIKEQVKESRRIESLQKKDKPGVTAMETENKGQLL